MALTREIAPPDDPGLTDYQGQILVAICTLFITLETISVLLRYYARHLTVAGLGWDDAIIPAAWLVNIGLCILCLVAVHHGGVGHHLSFVMKYHPQQFVTWGKCLYALEWLYLTSAALPKLSILTFYLRVFTRRDTRLACYFLIVFVIATWISFVVATNTKCIPLAYQWDKSIPGGHCFNIEFYYKSTSVPNIITDLAIIVLPMPTVFALQASRRVKAGLLFVFFVGSVGLVGSVIRMSTFFYHDAFTDNTWESVPLMGWTCIEPGMYLIAACLLTLRPVVHKWSPKHLKHRVYHSFRSSQKNSSDASRSTRNEGVHQPREGSFMELNRARNEPTWSDEITLPTCTASRDLSLNPFENDEGV